MYEVGQQVKLRSGKLAEVTQVINEGQYWVQLSDGQKLRTEIYNIVGLCGPQRMTLNDNRHINFTPASDTEFKLRSLGILKSAYTDAVDKLVRAKINMATALHQLDNAEAPDLQLQIAALACFRLTPPGAIASWDTAGRAWPKVSLEDYRRLIRYTVKAVDQIFRGITTEDFVICEVDKSAQKLANGQMVAGYVPAGVLERLVMICGGDAFQSFSSVQPLAGEIHVNLHDFLTMPWQISATIIHEASHKFCKTIDVHYVTPSCCNAMLTFVKLAASGAPQVDPMQQTEKLIGMMDSTLQSLPPAKLLNNADSYAYFAMLMGE